MTKSRVFDTARAGALVKPLGFWGGQLPAHLLPFMCIGALCLLVECPTALHAQPTLDESSPAPPGRQRSWNRSASKSDAESDLLLRIETREGVLLVYPSATPKDGIGRYRPFLAYWGDLRDYNLYVYGRTLLAEDDVGEAIESLGQQLGIDIDLFAKEYPPIVDSGMWVFGSLPSATWLVASRSSVLDVMGLPYVPLENPDDPPILPAVVGRCPMCAGVTPEPVWDAPVDVVLAEISKLVCSCCPSVECPVCDDGDECTRDLCEITCYEANCVYPTKSCSDGDPCTNDACNSQTGCYHTPKCVDNNPCIHRRCVDGSCVDTPAQCEGSDLCFRYWCDNETGCENEPICEAGDNCTFRYCGDGTCFEDPRDCDDGNECTTDSCVLPDGCVNAERSGSCTDDENICTDDICVDGLCKHPAKNGGSCPGFESNPCLNGICANGSCVANPLSGPSCADDENPCTYDVCDDGVCRHPPKDGISCDAYADDPCKDGVCLNRACSPVPLTGPSCPDDGNECTNDVCAAGACDHPANDGILCYAYFLDPCNNGICLNKACSPVPLTGPICVDDTNECTDDVCENGTCEHRCVPNCSVCQTDRFCLNCSCVASCCEASSTTQSVSASFPSWSGFKSALESTAAAAPMIQSLALTLEGDTTATRGETCCESAVPPPASPLTYYDYSVNASLGISVTLNVPGWYWNVSHTWPNVGSVSGQITLGPTLTVSPSASASVTGRSVPSLDCPGECVTIVGSAGIGVSGTFGGSATLSVAAEPNWLWDGGVTTVGATAMASAGTSANLSGSYIVPGCQTGSSGFQGGQLCYGALEGAVTLSVTILNVEWNATTQATFRDEGCW